MAMVRALGALYSGQLDEQGIFPLLFPVHQVEDKGTGNGNQNPQQIHGIGHQQRVLREE